MSLERWEPFSAVERFREDMDRMMEDFLVRPRGMFVRTGVRTLPVDVFETPDAVVVKATVAGIRPEEIEINVTGNMLTIRGERKEFKEEEREGQIIHQERWHGAFRRDITLPAAVQAERAEATFEDGELTLRLPKTAEARPTRIEVKSGQTGQQGTQAGRTTPGEPEREQRSH